MEALSQIIESASFMSRWSETERSVLDSLAIRYKGEVQDDRSDEGFIFASVLDEEGEVVLGVAKDFDGSYVVTNQNGDLVERLRNLRELVVVAPSSVGRKPI